MPESPSPSPKPRREYRVLLIDNFGPNLEFPTGTGRRKTSRPKLEKWLREEGLTSPHDVSFFADQPWRLPHLVRQLRNASNAEIKIEYDAGRGQRGTQLCRVTFSRFWDYIDEPLLRNASPYLPCQLKAVFAVHDLAVVVFSPDPRPAWLWPRLWFMLGFYHGRRGLAEVERVEAARDIIPAFQISKRDTRQEDEVREEIAKAMMPPAFANGARLTSDLGIGPIQLVRCGDDGVAGPELEDKLLREIQDLIQHWESEKPAFESPGLPHARARAVGANLLRLSDTRCSELSFVGYYSASYPCDVVLPLLNYAAQTKSLHGVLHGLVNLLETLRAIELQSLATLRFSKDKKHDDALLMVHGLYRLLTGDLDDCVRAVVDSLVSLDQLIDDLPIAQALASLDRQERLAAILKILGFDEPLHMHRQSQTSFAKMLYNIEEQLANNLADNADFNAAPGNLQRAKRAWKLVEDSGVLRSLEDLSKDITQLSQSFFRSISKSHEGVRDAISNAFDEFSSRGLVRCVVTMENQIAAVARADLTHENP